MALTVETGAVVAGADSYVTLEEYQNYAEARGWSLRASDTEDEYDIRRGYDVLNRKWSFRGEQVNEDVQTGEFPRYIIKNRFEYVVPADDVPQRVKDAQCELAYIVKSGTDPLATLTQSTIRQKVGPIEVETVPTGTPRLVAVEGLLRPYLTAGAGQVALVRG